MKQRNIIFLIVLFISISAKAASPYRLYELISGKYSEATTPLIPHRVYAVWDEKEKVWFVRVTDDKGKFSMPAQNLLPDSVYSARYLGGMRGQNYLLEANGNWVLTTKEEEYRYREEGRPNEMVIFTPKTK